MAQRKEGAKRGGVSHAEIRGVRESLRQVRAARDRGAEGTFLLYGRPRQAPDGDGFMADMTQGQWRRGLDAMLARKWGWSTGYDTVYGGPGCVLSRLTTGGRARP